MLIVMTCARLVVSAIQYLSLLFKFKLSCESTKFNTIFDRFVAFIFVHEARDDESDCKHNTKECE